LKGGRESGSGRRREKRKENKMKFGQMLKTHEVSAWSSQYLGYKELKKLIYAIRRKVDELALLIAASSASSASSTSDSTTVTVMTTEEGKTVTLSPPPPLPPPPPPVVPSPPVAIPPGVLPPSLENDFTTRPIELRFFLKLHRELKKIEHFYSEQLTKLQNRFVEWFQTVERLVRKERKRGEERRASSFFFVIFPPSPHPSFWFLSFFLFLFLFLPVLMCD
jgi:hypothetical protein